MGNMIESNATDKSEEQELTVTSVATKPLPLAQSPIKGSPQIVGASPLQTEGREVYETTEGKVDREELAESTPDNNYKMICRDCVIRDIVDESCNHCGIYHYIARLKRFKVNVRGGDK